MKARKVIEVQGNVSVLLGQLLEPGVSPPSSAGTTASQAVAPSRRGRCPETERQAVLRELHSERFVDSSPGQVSATLLDEGRYLASVVGWPSPRVGVHGGQVIAATKRWWRSWAGGEP